MFQPLETQHGRARIQYMVAPGGRVVRVDHIHNAGKLMIPTEREVKTILYDQVRQRPLLVRLEDTVLVRRRAVKFYLWLLSPKRPELNTLDMGKWLANVILDRILLYVFTEKLHAVATDDTFSWTTCLCNDATTRRNRLDMIVRRLFLTQVPFRASTASTIVILRKMRFPR